MDNIKAGLRVVLQASTGAQASKEGVIEAFLQVLSLYLTPAGIASLNPPEAALLMARYIGDLEEVGATAATEKFMRHLGPLLFPRQLPTILEAGNVVSIFQK